MVEIIKIDDVEYVKKDSIKEKASELNGMKYQIVRTQSAGVFAGYVESKDGQEVVIRNARRLWYWSGAASLSQLANDGVKKPNDCKFPQVVDKIELLQAIEILDVTEKAKKSIEETPIWEQ